MTRYLTPFQRRQRFHRRLRIALALAIAAGAAIALDRPLYELTYVGAGLDPEAEHHVRERLRNRDWFEFLRALGYLPTWFAVAAALAATQWGLRERAPLDPASSSPLADRWLPARVAASAILAGALAEALKPIAGRVRPHLTDGAYYFFSAPGVDPERLSFGLASSHAGVAFGGAFALAMAVPRLGFVTLPLAAACGYSRMAHGAHFFTDVLVAAIFAYAAARLLRRGGWQGPDA